MHTGGATESSPVLDENGNIYCAVNQCLTSVSSDGKRTWRWCSAINVDQTAAIAANGSIYFPAPWRRLVALNQSGAELWHADSESNVSNSPVIGNDGVVYMCAGRWLYAVIPKDGLAPPAKSSWPMFRANPRHTGRVLTAN
jgi:outer membrane protein assembly factor BamB